MKYIGCLVLTFLLSSITIFGQSSTVKTITTDYTLSKTDFNSLLIFTGSPSTFNKSYNLYIPPFTLKTDVTIPTGSRIYGVSITDGTVTILATHSLVTIISPNNANKTKDFGSYWQLIYLGKNVWVLNGDLYSTIIEAYTGDKVTIKAKIDSKATGPFTFIWFRNGLLLPLETKSTIELVNITEQDAGQYQVQVKNNAGTIKSEITTLIVK